LRGQYAHNHGVKSNDGTNGGFPKFYATGNEASTLATWLQDEGYRTALIGKYFNAYPEGLVPPGGFSFPGERYVPAGWDDWYGLLDIPKDERTDPYKMYGYPMNQTAGSCVTATTRMITSRTSSAGWRSILSKTTSENASPFSLPDTYRSPPARYPSAASP
jgi:arylsulfatase A-like enzyme